jgi:hypothetical protein
MDGATEHPPAWLMAAVDQRIALMDEIAGDLPLLAGDRTLVMTPLTEPKEGATQEEFEAWNRMCDRCGKDCRGSDFYTGHLHRMWKGTKLLFTFGVCPECKALSE